jgi:hypothetical protein
MIPELGTLEEVALRLAWTHEALGFTPWLAQHLDVLSDEIGIPLELEGVEVPVGLYKADILAKNPSDDTRVLIENQLEITDHDHLGKIMTYLAGLEAKTIIWIAPVYRDEHLSAVRWLNDHTTEEFAFFAIRVKVVRIANSPLAPVFEVLERPNEWERRIRDITKVTSKLAQQRLEFWEHYLARHPEELRHGGAQAVSNRWRMLDGLDMVLSYWLANVNVGVFIRGVRGANAHEVYQQLAPHADALQRATGVEMGDPAGPYYFIKRQPANWTDRDQWDGLADWIFETANTYEQALRQIAIAGPKS